MSLKRRTAITPSRLLLDQGQLLWSGHTVVDSAILLTHPSA